ncbi:DgyrCDS3245 [Dimorphilus gyrociliatus]|uniref:DgyrCDS3245 n=1 Tax=Dimorphilus gyrociliatus TaxID=2664684 RepID=A0A7I8VEJ0_9ANNE|nr:DgyrCDS3245 [Dimorphilus gyrociliatus]
MACWFPVSILGLISMNNNIVLEKSLYRWIALFLIPLNSVLNPLFYSGGEILAIVKRLKLKGETHLRQALEDLRKTQKDNYTLFFKSSNKKKIIFDNCPFKKWQFTTVKRHIGIVNVLAIFKDLAIALDLIHGFNFMIDKNDNKCIVYREMNKKISCSILLKNTVFAKNEKDMKKDIMIVAELVENLLKSRNKAE